MTIMDTAALAAKYLALFTVPALLLVFSYRVFFHPLRNYPGPPLAKLSNGYAGFYAIWRRLHLTTYQDQKKYGPVMRHGPNKLIFNSAQALQDIYNNEKFTKAQVYTLTGASSGPPSIFSAIDRTTHRTKRRLIGQAVSDKATRQFEPTMLEQIDIFLGQLLASSRAGKAVDMTERTKRLGMDIVGLLAFGFPLHIQTQAENRFMLRGLSVGSYQNNCFMQWPLLKKLGLHNLVGLLGRKQREKYRAILQHMIKTRLAEDPHAHHDLYSVTVDSGIDLSELWSEALFFFPAAGDTTSTTLSALFFYVSRDRTVYQRLAQEIRTTFTTSAEIKKSPKLAGCRYLRACIDETLRMSPSVTGTLWRELYADQRSTRQGQPTTVLIDGHAVPAGTQVGVCMYSIHHNEEYFPDPFAFRPKRWLEEGGGSDGETLRRMQSAFSPFSMGARGCAGTSFAYLEMSLVVAKVLWYFDFEKEGDVGGGEEGRTNGRGRTGEFQLYDTFGSQHEGPNLVFQPRGELVGEVEVRAPEDV